MLFGKSGDDESPVARMCRDLVVDRLVPRHHLICASRFTIPFRDPG
jgi:hypothetical protein